MLGTGFQLLDASLRVSSLERSSAFYSGVLGLSPEPAGEGRLRFRSGLADPLLTLQEVPGIQPALEGAPGLFHLAFLVPKREDLARVLRRLGQERWPILGASDHGVSEAIYLADPDGNGLEIYRDRPRDRWPTNQGRISMGTEALDLYGLLGSDPSEAAEGLPPGTRIGHIHLRVTDLEAAERFWTDQMGLDVTVRDYPGALFFSADGYHHHVGVNTWGLAERTSIPHAGLESVRIAMPAAVGAKVVGDTDGNRFEIVPA